MFKTQNLSQILLILNNLKTEFTLVSENRKQVSCRFRVLLWTKPRVLKAQGVDKACGTWNKNQKRIGNFRDVLRQIAQDCSSFFSDFRNLKIPITKKNN